MKKLSRSLVLGVLVAFLVSSNSFAKPFNPNEFTSVNIESKVLPPSVKESFDRVVSVLKGAFFSAADLRIKNENGEIGITGHAFMSVPVEEIYMTIYIDQKNEKEDRWVQVAYYDFEFYAKDYPNGLTSETVSFIIDNQPKNKVYRARGSYAAFKDGAMEGFGPVTDGVLIE
ncbi:MAG: hypothetical protein KH230_03220 [Enterocloster asparagiformis]|nr:hypothetical protein [Enterocloster asparagiformis]